MGLWSDAPFTVVVADQEETQQINFSFSGST